MTTMTMKVMSGPPVLTAARASLSVTPCRHLPGVPVAVLVGHLPVGRVPDRRRHARRLLGRQVQPSVRGEWGTKLMSWIPHQVISGGRLIGKHRPFMPPRHHARRLLGRQVQPAIRGRTVVVICYNWYGRDIALMDADHERDGGLTFGCFGSCRPSSAVASSGGSGWDPGQVLAQPADALHHHPHHHDQHLLRGEDHHDNPAAGGEEGGVMMPVMTHGRQRGRRMDH
jgi:hypothetical protein